MAAAKFTTHIFVGRIVVRTHKGDLFDFLDADAWSENSLLDRRDFMVRPLGPGEYVELRPK